MKFKPEDLEVVVQSSTTKLHTVCEFALFLDALNARLTEMLAEAPIIYSKHTSPTLGDIWDIERYFSYDTHQARLVDIKKIVERSTKK